MIVLGIESSCDETACSVVREGREILSNVVAAQAELHELYGGVVPELACRRHVDVIVPVIDRALKEAGISLEQVDLIAVARGPGLVGALMIGMSAAKALAIAAEKPLIGVNHVEAHFYAALMSQKEEPLFPCLGAVLSGGHTALVLMERIGRYRLLGETLDDAIGEAFDKVAKMMGLPYPGGPVIEELAKEGDPARFPMRAGRIKGRPLHFSFSGLKTAALYSLEGRPLTRSLKCDIAASFQESALSDVIKKTLLAAEQEGVDTLLFGGGVANSRTLRARFAAEAPGKRLLWPNEGLSLDNAAMIAGLGYHKYCERGGDPLHLEAASRIPLTEVTDASVTGICRRHGRRL